MTRSKSSFRPRARRSAKLGGGLADKPATELGADRDQSGARTRGPGAGRGRVRDHGPGPCRRVPARLLGVRPRSARHSEESAPAINKVCASSIRAVEIADSMINAGDHQVIVTGGMESMSNAPYLLGKGALRLQARRRHAHRLDDPRRADVVVRPAAHGRAGLLRLARARDPTRGAGPPGLSGHTSGQSRPSTKVASRTRSSQSVTLRSTRGLAGTRRSGWPR